MKLRSLLAPLAFLALSAPTPSRAALFSFTFTPDLTIGDDIGASGQLTADDAPFMSNVTSVSGQAGGLGIDGIADGYNILDPDLLSAFFTFSATFKPGDDPAQWITYTFDIGSSAFATYALTVSGSDGTAFQALGDLDVAVLSPSTVPLPPSASLLGMALVGLGVAGRGLRRRAAAVAK